MQNKLNYKDLTLMAAKKENGWLKYLNRNKKKLEAMDLKIHSLHEEISERTDCLQCANCCRTLGPRITQKDVEKMARALRLKTGDVITRYLRIDEDDDMVFREMPCPFLGPDNYCDIYESRPKACREYPHTDRKKFFQIYKLSVKNAYTCPIVYEVLEGIQEL
ncbi:MAG: YkgJ family cysteine cluster protein [Paludibacteraceae bacterium]|nr:YkgJ family cysteine cluster protein [Paludibacteraceae bacterium]